MYLWIFLTYGFLGYLLEKAFALVTRSRHTVRKGYLLLPVCPVYGLAMLAVLALPPDMTDTFWHLALYGGLTATAVEYAVHFCCDRLLGVMFWDYSSTKMDLNRRVCLPFALIWGPLAAAAVACLHTAVADAGGVAAADRRQLLHRPSAASLSRHRPAGLEKPSAPPLRRLNALRSQIVYTMPLHLFLTMLPFRGNI